MANIIFYFSGTGNCLKVAKTIAQELGNAEIVSMAKSGQYSLTKQYDTIGFVYPTYFGGLPKKVAEFAGNLVLNNNKSAYFYSITTYGGAAVNAVYQLYKLFLDKHGIKINYGQKLRMFSNYVVLYNMSKKVHEITKRSNEKLIPIIAAIKNKENNKIKKLTGIFASILNKNFVKKVSNMDANYLIGTTCTGCGICKAVCPVNNIEIVNAKPQFSHHCEQCIACMQYCPQKAINYGNKTQNRRRYTHPEINYKELSESNKR